MSDVRVRTLERLFQMAAILGRATENVTKLNSNMTVALASLYFNCYFDCIGTKQSMVNNTRDLKNVASKAMYNFLITARRATSAYFWGTFGNFCSIFFGRPRFIFGNL